MEVKKMWIAKWRQDGILHTHTFESTDNRLTAGIDFRFSLLDQGKDVPKAYFLDTVENQEAPEKKEE